MFYLIVNTWMNWLIGGLSFNYSLSNEVLKRYFVMKC